MEGQSPSLPTNVKLFVYLSHSLSAWGDRMWSFGVGLFLVIIHPESLIVTAVYGFSRCGSVLLFGALVGDWIDRTARLTAARVTLIIQNLSVILCAIVVFFVVTYKPWIETRWPDEGMLYLSYVVIIVIAITANLASMGNKIAIQRDWIIEICGGDKDRLATMSATMRRIDLTTQILAPVASGQIMYFGSPGIGALFIAGWNFVSVFVEYYLLWKVYNIIPALQVEKGKKEEKKEFIEEEREIELQVLNEADARAKEHNAEREPLNVDEEQTTTNTSNNTPGQKDKQTKNFIEEEREIELQVLNEADTGPEESNAEREPLNVDEEQITTNTPNNTPGQTDKQTDRQSEGCCAKMFSRFLILGRGWKIYMSYDVAFAGLGLACLYMTVLGFDSITVGYAYGQCVNELVMGLLQAAGGLSGILGTILFPIIRLRIGLPRTGLFGLFLEVMCLSLCVASIWSPGSPFDPFYWSNDPENREPTLNNTSISLADNNGTQTGYIIYNNTGSDNMTIVLNMTTSPVSMTTSPVSMTTSPISMTTTSSESKVGQAQRENFDCKEGRQWTEFISVGLLMAGIVGARCGLWLSDLTITQLFLENVKETQRGVVNGVQQSLNMLMDMLKFIMVIAAPQPEVFGILILISFAFILLGWASYAKYSRSVRGHLFHFDPVQKCMNGNNNNVIVQTEDTQAGGS